MFKSLLARAGAFRRRLTHLDNQPLSKAAVIVLVFLDVFILSSIFDGLDVHTRQLQGPEQRIPQLCQDIVLNGNWNPSSRLENLTRLVVTHNTRPYAPPADPAGEGMYPLCQSVMNTSASLSSAASREASSSATRILPRVQTCSAVSQPGSATSRGSCW